MSTHVHLAVVSKPPPASAPLNFLQRQCACNKQDDLHQKRISGLQAKHIMGRPADRWEQEADQTVGFALNGRRSQPEPANAPVLTHLAGPALATDELPVEVRAALRSPAEPLDPGTRAFMEDRFSYDFSRVSVHTDRRAVESASTLGALAFTLGSDIVFGTGQYAPRTAAGQRLLAHELAHVVQQSSSSPAVPQIQRQASLTQPTGSLQLPDQLTALTASNKAYFQQLIVQGNVPLQPHAARLTGDREHDTTILAEYFLCSVNFESPGIDPDPLFCLDPEVTRHRPIFVVFREKVIKPEYDQTRPDLLELLRIRQSLLQAIEEDLIFIGDKNARADDKNLSQVLEARNFASFKSQLTEAIPATDPQGNPVSPTPQLLSTLKVLTDATRSRRAAGVSQTKTDFSIISLLRPKDPVNSPHRQGRAADISIYAGQRIDMFHPQEALDGIVQLIEDLPPGNYFLGLPRQPRRDRLLGCIDFFSTTFKPYISRLYQPTLFGGGCPHGPPNIRQEILNLRNMFYPWYFTPGNAYNLNSIEDPEAKTRLKDVVARKAPQVQIGSGPDAPDHVHLDVK